MNRVSTTERSGQYERKFSNVCGRVNSAHRDDGNRVSPRSHSRIFCVISDSRPDRVGSALLLRIDSGTRLVDTVPLAVFSGANPMKTQSTSSFPALTEKWIREHLELDQWVSELVAWMDDVSKLGIPRFGQAGTQLNQLRHRLVEHFHVEDQIAIELCESRPSCMEVQAARRQAARDHDQLLARMDDLYEKLMQLEPPFASWQDAVQQIGLFVDVLEQHEEQESENIHWLSP